MTSALSLNKVKTASLMDLMELERLLSSDALESFGQCMEVMLNALEEDNYSSSLKLLTYQQEISEIKLSILIQNLKCSERVTMIDTLKNCSQK